MVSLPLSQLARYGPPRKLVPLTSSTPLAGHRIASSVSERPTRSTTTARTAPPADTAADAFLDPSPGDLAGPRALIRPNEASTPATISGSPIEKMPKKPSRSNPATEIPSKSGRHRPAEAYDERLAQIAMSAI